MVIVQVLIDPVGRLAWDSPALLGAVHDLTAARTYGVVAAPTTAVVAVFADKGYVALGARPVPQSRGGDPPKQWGAVNRAHVRIRALGE